MAPSYCRCCSPQKEHDEHSKRAACLQGVRRSRSEIHRVVKLVCAARAVSRPAADPEEQKSESRERSECNNKKMTASDIKCNAAGESATVNPQRDQHKIARARRTPLQKRKRAAANPSRPRCEMLAAHI